MKFFLHFISVFSLRRPGARALSKHVRGRLNLARMGFTLIELLVTISIVTILTSLLFPVFSRVRENARRSSCASNQKQLLLGLSMYGQDYDGYFTPAGDPFTAPGGWSERLQPYLKNSQLLQCPGETTRQGNIALDYTDYYYNLNLGPDTGSVHEAALEFAANTIVLGEGTSRESNYSCLGLGSNECFFSLFTETLPASATKRHLDGANYAFADNHVKWLHPTAIVGSSISASSQRNSFQFAN